MLVPFLIDGLDLLHLCLNMKNAFFDGWSNACGASRRGAVLNRFATVEYLKTVPFKSMTCGRNRFRVTLHAEGLNSKNVLPEAQPNSPDFEKVLTTELFGPVSRLDLLQHISAWVCSENLLHEHSAEVSHRIINAVRNGIVHDNAELTNIPLVGRSTSPSLMLQVEQTLLHENVALALGSLCILVPGDTIKTSVGAVRVDCTVEDESFRLSAQISPLKVHGLYSECFRQTRVQCASVTPPRVPMLLQHRAPGSKKTLSHRTHRLNCQQVHAANVRLASKSDTAQHSFSTQEVLSRKISLFSTKTNGAAEESIHTIFFR